MIDQHTETEASPKVDSWAKNRHAPADKAVLETATAELIVAIGSLELSEENAGQVPPLITAALIRIYRLGYLAAAGDAIAALDKEG